MTNTVLEFGLVIGEIVKKQTGAYVVEVPNVERFQSVEDILFKGIDIFLRFDSIAGRFPYICTVTTNSDKTIIEVIVEPK